MIPPPVKVSLRQRVIVTAISGFWGTIVGVQVLWSFLWSPRKFLSYEEVDELPPCATSPEIGGHSSIAIETATGRLNFHYVAQGTRGKPLMLFLHGFPECWYSWRYQMKGPFRNDYWMVAVDMRGYGGTDKPSGIENYRMDVLSDDVKRLIIGLGYEKCVLVAHDWGGAIAWNFSMHEPDMIEKLIVMNAPHAGSMQRVEGVGAKLKQFFMSWYMFFFQLPILPEMNISSFNYRMLRSLYAGKSMGVVNKERITEDDLKVFLYYFQPWKARQCPINYYRAAMTYRVAKSKLPIECKALLIWGTGDKALSTPLAEITARMCKDCTIKYVDGASHWVQQDEPDQVNRHMQQFLQE